MLLTKSFLGISSLVTTPTQMVGALPGCLSKLHFKQNLLGVFEIDILISNVNSSSNKALSSSQSTVGSNKKNTFG